jgi:hypothetical protein
VTARPWLLAGAAASWVLAGCASIASAPPPGVHPYKAILLPVGGAKAALADPPGPDSIPVAATPETLEKSIHDALLAAPMFSSVVPVGREELGDHPPEEVMAAAAEIARKYEADLILRVQIRSARLTDLGRNGATVWSCFLWFMVPLPIWTVDDRSYGTDFRVDADLFAPDDLQKPVASLVVTTGEQTLDAWDRGFSPLILIFPPPFVRGSTERVSGELTKRVVEEATRALVEQIRRREIPSRFELLVSTEAGGIRVAAASRRKLRCIEVRLAGRPAKSWLEADLEPDEVSPERGFVYRKALQVEEAGDAGTEVRVIVEDEGGGREVRTLVLGGKP